VSRRPRSGVAGAERSRSVSVGVLDLSYFAPFGSWWSDLPTVWEEVDGTSGGGD
jgi:hypothetical protein